MAADRLNEQSDVNRSAPVTQAEDRPPPTMLETMTAQVGTTVMQRKLSERAVQRKSMEGAGSDDAGDMHKTAQAGVSGGGGQLPHLDAIQSAFGRHSVAGIQAHTGGAAGAANQAMNAQGYAMGNSVAFAGSPDLHTAAHEAAHVVQQRGGVDVQGGVGKSGDKYESHADAVADQVVQGKSAESLLDKMSGSGGGGAAVQHKNTIVDDKKDKTNQKHPGEGKGVLQEEGGKINPRITFGPLQDGCATTMTAVLKPTGDDLDGSTPDNWPPWWAASQPSGGNDYWVQGHLLNMKLGGPGEARNLTPITKKANARHHSYIEKYAKEAAKDGDSIEYTVTALYDGKGPRLTEDATNPKKAVWPKICRALECTLKILDKHNGHKKDGPAPLSVLNVR
jgi:hypothetical protein